MFLTNFEKDALREMSNIGAGHAVTSLSRMVDEFVDLNIPKLHIIAGSQIVDHHPNHEYIVHCEISGELNGYISIYLSKREGLNIIKKLTMSNDDLVILDDLGIDALKELGNIMSGSFLSSLNNFLNMNLLLGAPLFLEDKNESIKELMKLEGKMAKLNIDFNVYDENSFSNLWLMLDKNSTKLILNKAKQK